MCSLVYTSYCFGVEGGFSGREGIGGALPGPVFGTVGGGGVFWEPLEKTVMFLNVPFCREAAALSGLSDEPMRPKPHR